MFVQWLERDDQRDTVTVAQTAPITELNTARWIVVDDLAFERDGPPNRVRISFFEQGVPGQQQVVLVLGEPGEYRLSAAQEPTIVGIYSSIRYIAAAGDPVGRELEISRDSTGFVARYREAVGTLSCTWTMGIDIQADSIMLQHPVYGTFRGSVAPTDVRGRFDSETRDETMPRVSAPYRETGPCPN